MTWLCLFRTKILKLIPYDDRPEHRLKDLEDIAFIVRHYVDIVGDELYEEQVDLLEADISLQPIGARILGRHIRPLLDQSVVLYNRLQAILKREINSGEDGSFARSLRQQGMPDGTADTALQQIRELRDGIRDDHPLQAR